MLVNIDVSELAPAITFYKSTMGLNLCRIRDEDVAELIGASCTIYLQAHAGGSEPARSVAEVRRYSRHWSPVHIDFVVDDIESSAKQAITAI